MATMTKPTDEPPAVSPAIRASSSVLTVEELEAVLPVVPAAPVVVEAPGTADAAPAPGLRASDSPGAPGVTAPVAAPLPELGPDAAIVFPPALRESEPLAAPLPVAQDVYPPKAWSHFEVKETPKRTARIICSALTSMGVAYEFDETKWEYNCVRKGEPAGGEAACPDLEFKILLLEKDVYVVVEAIRGRESDGFKFYQTVSVLMARVRGGGADVKPPTYKDYIVATSPKATTGDLGEIPPVDLLEGLEDEIVDLSSFDVSSSRK